MVEDLVARCRAHADRLIWIAVAAGVLLRLQGLGWDEWRQFHPDERNLVAGAAQLAFPDAMIPEFHAYNGLALALPKLLAWAAYGPAPDAAAITWAARVVSALASGAAVWVGAAVAWRMGGPLAGALAAALLALSAPLIQWAHFGTTESVLILAALGIWHLAIRFLDGDAGLWPIALLLGVAFGLALGFKTTAASFAIFPLTAAAMRWRAHGVRLLAAGAAAAALAGAIFVATTPSLVLAARDYLDVMEFEAGVVSGRLDVFWTWQFFGARDGLFELAQLWGLLEGGGLVLAALGIALALQRRIAAAAPALVFLAAYCALVFGWHAKFVRYLAPILPILLVFAALGAAHVFERLRSRALAMATSAALVLFAVSGATLAASYQARDPRLAAAAWLEGQLAPSEIVLLEPVEVGPVDFGPNETRILQLIAPAGPAKTTELAETVAAGDWIVVYSRRHSGVLPRLPDRFPAACAYYAALIDGRLGFQEVASFGRARFLDGLLRPSLSAEETRVVFDRPEVRIYEKRREMAAADVRAILEAEDPSCRASNGTDAEKRS